MKRLFIAVDFEPTVIEQIQNIFFGVRNARWVRSDQIHLTLRFLGDCEESTFEEILSELHQIQHNSFTIKIKGVGYFPPRGKPNVLWIGIDKSTELYSLLNSIQHSLLKIGIQKESRKFYPHITIARIKNKIKPSEIVPFLTSNSLFRIDKIPVNKFQLYSSILKPTGALHTIEETYHLL